MWRPVRLSKVNSPAGNQSDKAFLIFKHAPDSVAEPGAADRNPACLMCEVIQTLLVIEGLLHDW
jgi:hypothetical protein